MDFLGRLRDGAEMTWAIVIDYAGYRARCPSWVDRHELAGPGHTRPSCDSLTSNGALDLCKQLVPDCIHRPRSTYFRVQSRHRDLMAIWAIYGAEIGYQNEILNVLANEVAILDPLFLDLVQLSVDLLYDCHMYKMSSFYIINLGAERVMIVELGMLRARIE